MLASSAAAAHSVHSAPPAIIGAGSHAIVYRVGERARKVARFGHEHLLREEAGIHQTAHAEFQNLSAEGVFDGVSPTWYRFAIPRMIEDHSDKPREPSLDFEAVAGLNFFSQFYLDFYADKMPGANTFASDREVENHMEFAGLGLLPPIVFEEDPFGRVLFNRMSVFWHRKLLSTGIDQVLRILSWHGISPTDPNPGNFIEDFSNRVIYLIDFWRGN